MTLNGKPWMIGGGVEHPVEVARALAYMATQGSSGVGTPGSFKVTALPTPGTAVRCAAGIGAAANAYPGGTNQSYVLQGTSSTDVPVTPTGSTGGRTDLVVARVTDPQYEGQFAEDPNAVDYASIEIIQGVPANTRGTRGLGLAFPAVALARLDIPASTATITDAMITDLRRLVAPRQVRALETTGFGSTADVRLTSSTKVQWPDVSKTFFVPSWANRAQVAARLNSVFAVGATSGELDVRLGSLISSNADYDVQNGGSVTTRETLGIVGAWSVPSSMRETEQTVRVFGNRDSSKTGYLSMRRGVQIEWDVTFFEAVE